MTPLEATVQIMQNWAVTGLLKGRTPDELRGDAISLYTGLQGATLVPKRPRATRKHADNADKQAAYRERKAEEPKEDDKW